MEEKLEYVRRVTVDLANSRDVENISLGELERMAEKTGVRTVYGSLAFNSKVRSRSAKFTVHIGSNRVLQRNLTPVQLDIYRRSFETVLKVKEYLEKLKVIRIDRMIGDNPYFTPSCILLLSSRSLDSYRLGYMWVKTLFEPSSGNPSLYLVDVPEWPETQILVFPEIGVTYVLGTDYFGEVKKGFLRMAMWYAKQIGMLGLHAGAKVAYVRSDGKLKTYSMLLFGLSGTGKTTHSCHNHYLNEEGENVEIVQDDVVFLMKDGSILGSERGFFVKTDGISKIHQPVLYKALTMPNVVFENVLVDKKGRVRFEDSTLTKNGRAIVPMENLRPYASKSVNIPSLEYLDGLKIFFITRRNTILPPIEKLSPEKAAAVFMLGESVETSAGDPKKAGKPVNVVGTNPFIVGDEAEEGNWIYEFLIENKGEVDCYLLNTGSVGAKAGSKGVKITVEISSKIIRAALKDEVEWKRNEYLGAYVPKKVDSVNIAKYEPERYYTPGDLAKLSAKLSKERMNWLSQFDGLDRKILNSILPKGG